MDSMYKIFHFYFFFDSITWIFVEFSPLCIKFKIYQHKVVHSSLLTLSMSARFVVISPFSFLPLVIRELSFHLHQSWQRFNFFISLFKELHFSSGPLFSNVFLLLSFFFPPWAFFFFFNFVMYCSLFTFLKKMLASLIFNLLFYCMHIRL